MHCANRLTHINCQTEFATLRKQENLTVDVQGDVLVYHRPQTHLLADGTLPKQWLSLEWERASGYEVFEFTKIISRKWIEKWWYYSILLQYFAMVHLFSEMGAVERKLNDLLCRFVFINPQMILCCLHLRCEKPCPDKDLPLCYRTLFKCTNFISKKKHHTSH